MMEIQAVHVAGLTLLAHADDWKNIPGSLSQIQHNKPQIKYRISTSESFT